MTGVWVPLCGMEPATVIREYLKLGLRFDRVEDGDAPRPEDEDRPGIGSEGEAGRVVDSAPSASSSTCVTANGAGGSWRNTLNTRSTVGSGAGDTTTAAPEQMIALAELLSPLGVAFVEAEVAGGGLDLLVEGIHFLDGGLGDVDDLVFVEIGKGFLEAAGARPKAALRQRLRPAQHGARGQRQRRQCRPPIRQLRPAPQPRQGQPGRQERRHLRARRPSGRHPAVAQQVDRPRCQG